MPEDDGRIKLISEKELRIYMHPLRQKIMNRLGILGKPATAKQIADALEISPSSALHHLKQLQSIGVVELDHTELINGITAKFLKASDKVVNIGIDIVDKVPDVRKVLVENAVSENLRGLFQNAEYKKSALSRGEEVVDLIGDSRSGVIHLTNEEVNELSEIINNYVIKHNQIKKDTHPYSYSLVSYRADLRGERGEK